MSHPAAHEDEGPTLKPRPRRVFSLSSAPPSAPPTPPLEAESFPNPVLSTGKASSISDSAGAITPSRTKSFLNLTASTLFGIYQPSGIGTETENPTPWGHGAQTPAVESRQGSFDFSRVNQLPETVFEQGRNGRVRRRSTASQTQRQQIQRTGFRGYYLPLAGRTLALFAVGMLYGILIGHLQDHQRLAPVAINLDRSKAIDLVIWGCIGAVLGNMLPWADVFWAPYDDVTAFEARDEKDRGRGREQSGLDAWIDVVRSIALFVGIAFAIRKLPWQSTMQMSLTLALANPAIWYIIDRSPPGFIMSTLVAIGGTAVLFAINPTLVPSPSPWQTSQGRAGANQMQKLSSEEDLVLGIFSPELVGVATWIASVLFVSSVCFGNIGRRLPPHSN